MFEILVILFSELLDYLSQSFVASFARHLNITWVLDWRTTIQTEQVQEAIGLDGLLELVVIVRVLPDILLDLSLDSFETHHEGSLARSR